MPARPFRHALCLAGDRACPPEDCGGLSGFAEVLHAVAHPDEADPDLVAWRLRDYDPSGFDPITVEFSNPRTRLRAMQRR